MQSYILLNNDFYCILHIKKLHNKNVNLKNIFKLIFTVYPVQKQNLLSVMKFKLSSRFYSLESWFILNHGSKSNRFQEIIISLKSTESSFRKVGNEMFEKYSLTTYFDHINHKFQKSRKNC